MSFPNIVISNSPTVSFPQGHTPTVCVVVSLWALVPPTISVRKHKLAAQTGHEERPRAGAL